MAKLDLRKNFIKIFRKIPTNIRKNLVKPLGIYARFKNDVIPIDEAIKVMEKDWDYLVVLDACRYDLFDKITGGKGGYVISGGTGTQSWLEWNFNSRYDNCIYIAGNPHLSSTNLKKTFGFIPFSKVVDVWDFGWDEKIKTVPPEEVTSAALHYYQEYPKKRMIIHYNQPHHPFITSEELLSLDDGTWSNRRDMKNGKKSTVWDGARLGKISLEFVWKGYENNLKLVMKHVSKLIKNLSGKVVITSDHGNLLGEYGMYGHGSILRLKELVKVPWWIAKKRKPSASEVISKRIEESRIKRNIEKLKNSDRL